MMNKQIKKECPFSDEIVSYIYNEFGEFGGLQPTAFEDHLLGCMKCTDEFAAVSEARFSVFEWNKEEFSPLATPRFAIPYETKSAGWFDGLRGFLTGSMWPAAATASVLLIIGLGVMYNVELKPQFDNVSIKPEQTKSDAAIIVNPVDIVNNILPAKPVTANDEKLTKASGNVTKANPYNRPVKANLYRPVKPGIQLTAETLKTETTAIDPNSKKQLRKAPVLSNYDEDDDNSLRLTDLFDEGGV